MECRTLALAALCEADPGTKAQAAQAAHAACVAGAPIDLRRELVFAPAPAVPRLPGRPLRPVLVEPAQVPRRTPFSPAGRAALLHAVAHIEFNAINLALDAVWRFAGMPPAYYSDWLRVASEEATHFGLLQAHLQAGGHSYGDFEAHDGLWLMCEKTAKDITARMALVPRTLEARGLDATPPMRAKFARAGDARAVEILDIILRDEIGHVAIGNRWYRWLCVQQGLDPVAHYPKLAQAHGAPKPKPPFNVEARLAAGFSDEELSLLHGPSGEPRTSPTRSAASTGRT